MVRQKIIPFLRLLSMSCMSLLIVSISSGFCAGSPYSIQVGAYESISVAVNEVMKLRQAGYDAFWKRGPEGGRDKLYRVIVVGHVSFAETKREAQRLKERGLISDYFVRNAEKVASHQAINAQGAVHERSLGREGVGPEFDRQGRGSLIREKQGGAENRPSLEVRDIKVDRVKDGKEQVLIRFNRYYWPRVFFALYGERPRLVIKIKEGKLLKNETSRKSINQRLIRAMQIQFQDNKQNVRITLYLHPYKSYRIRQSFCKLMNSYAIGIMTGRMEHEA
ncbi:MAG: SPOR domain-containing protein [Deltaproteobacteria bacterium]|nr:SPOR domain-containing protein [Deltaproteobacteria bacterium]MBW2139205.1 SPOR domain-containing protein [Deltaproteobacteria bacterium]